MRPTTEALEPRQLLSAAKHDFHPIKPVYLGQALSVAQVQTVLAQAASQALPTQAVAVTDREGTVLGVWAGKGLDALPRKVALGIVTDAVARARTVSLFESSGEAFTTRTARFIIQDHFPYPVKNTPGGPLYGVEFSDLVNSDILPPANTPAIVGDPGGIPLYLNGVTDPSTGKLVSVPAGGVGVAGDFHDKMTRPDLMSRDAAGNIDTSTYTYMANQGAGFKSFDGHEESDFDEAVAMAGAFNFMAPSGIRANQIFVAGLRFPFAANAPAHARPTLSFAALASSASTTFSSATIVAGTPEKDSPGVTFGGDPGLLRQRNNLGGTLTDPQPDANLGLNSPLTGIVPGHVNGGQQLTVSDVEDVFNHAVSQALKTRAGIRKPNGINAEVHVVVVDTTGAVLGAFRMHDGTNFSYDVAVQKARTAAFFSDNQHAFSCRAVGFVSQKYFPPGILQNLGPMFHLQNSLNLNDPTLGLPVVLNPNFKNTPLADGITIFPGGVPLYKNGVLVGAVGISGDGVDQDDIIAFAGSHDFPPPPGARSDELSYQGVIDWLSSRVQLIDQIGGIDYDPNLVRQRFEISHRVRLPYVKFPRNPEH